MPANSCPKNKPGGAAFASKPNLQGQSVLPVPQRSTAAHRGIQRHSRNRLSAGYPGADEQYLSESYKVKQENPALELKVDIYNINYEKVPEIIARSKRVNTSNMKYKMLEVCWKKFSLTNRVRGLFPTFLHFQRL